MVATESTCDADVAVGFLDPESLALKMLRRKAFVFCDLESGDMALRKVFVMRELDVPFCQAIGPFREELLQQVHQEIASKALPFNVRLDQPLQVHIIDGYFESNPTFNNEFTNFETTPLFKAEEVDSTWLQKITKSAVEKMHKRLSREQGSDSDSDNYYDDTKTREEIRIGKKAKRIPTGIKITTAPLPVILQRALFTFTSTNLPNILLSMIQLQGKAITVLKNETLVKVWKSHMNAFIHAPLNVQNALRWLKDSSTPWSPRNPENRQSLIELCEYLRSASLQPLPDDMVLFRGGYATWKYSDEATCHFKSYSTSPMVASNFERTHLLGDIYSRTIRELREESYAEGFHCVPLWLSITPFPIPMFVRDLLTWPTFDFRGTDRKEYEVVVVRFRT